MMTLVVVTLVFLFADFLLGGNICKPSEDCGHVERDFRESSRDLSSTHPPYVEKKRG